MGNIDDAKAAVAAAQSSLDTANTVLADIEGETTVSDRTVTGVTIKYSDGSSAEFALEDTATGLPPTGDTAGNQGEVATETPSADSSDTVSSDTPADSSGESTAVAPDVAAGTVPE